MTAPVPPIGLMVYLKSLLTNTHIYAVVSDGATPDQYAVTMEIQGDQATLVVPALMGPQGPAGTNAFALRLQKSLIDDPEDLPTNLQDIDEDIGKYWIMNHYATVNEVQTVTLNGGPTSFTSRTTASRPHLSPVTPPPRPSRTHWLLCPMSRLATSRLSVTPAAHTP